MSQVELQFCRSYCLRSEHRSTVTTNWNFYSSAEVQSNQLSGILFCWNFAVSNFWMLIHCWWCYTLHFMCCSLYNVLIQRSDLVFRWLLDSGKLCWEVKSAVMFGCWSVTDSNLHKFYKGHVIRIVQLPCGRIWLKDVLPILCNTSTASWV
jgi:hypothetical protein